MRYRYLTGIIFLTLMTSSYATSPTLLQGTCARITGSWYGNFTFKDKNDCRTHHGCSHPITIHVSRYDGPTYQADVSPKNAPPETFLIRCYDGKITSPSHPISNIELNCPDNTVCIVKYNDENKYATFIGAGVD